MSRDILKAYRVTEKAANLQANANQYTFEVADDARAPEIKQAVEKLFKVKVERINIINAKGKVKATRLARAKPGIKGKMKKAIVTVKAGESIQLV